VSLVVNVASACGFTDKHYKGLVRLQSILGKTGKFIVLAFPCNQFAGQEPGPESNILKFVQEKYQVNFAVFGKINVLEKDVPEAWNYIIRESGNAPNWNFWKYLVDHKGKVIGSWGPWSDVEEIFPAVKTAVD
ncbi:Glutathione peroxidase 7, partial [Lamellibrachia satsuma]